MLSEPTPRRGWRDAFGNRGGGGWGWARRRGPVRRFSRSRAPRPTRRDGRQVPGIYNESRNQDTRRALRNPPLARRSMTKCHVSGRRANHLPVFLHSPKTPTRRTTPATSRSVSGRRIGCPTMPCADGSCCSLPDVSLVTSVASVSVAQAISGLRSPATGRCHGPGPCRSPDRLP